MGIVLVNFYGELLLSSKYTSFAGFNVETVEYKNISFTVWDVGGQDKVRSSDPSLILIFY